MTRVGDALHRIAREHDGKTVVVVCHGGVVDASLLIGLGMAAIAPAVGKIHTHKRLSRSGNEGYSSARRKHSVASDRYNDDLRTPTSA